MSFAMKKYGGPGLKWKVLSRTLKLFVIGLLTQGASVFDNRGIDLHGMRIPGILQRIAWAYCVVAAMKMYLPVYTADGFLSPAVAKWADAPRDKFAIFKHYALHWAVALGFVFIYVGIMLFAHVPSWEYSRPAGWAMDDGELDTDCDEVGNKTLGTFRQVCTTEWKHAKTWTVSCDTHGDLTPQCSAARMVDEWLLGWSHMYDEGCEGCSECNPPAGQKQAIWCDARYDPEGVLSSVPTVMTTWLGLHFGQVGVKPVCLSAFVSGCLSACAAVCPSIRVWAYLCGCAPICVAVGVCVLVGVLACLHVFVRVPALRRVVGCFLVATKTFAYPGADTRWRSGPSSEALGGALDCPGHTRLRHLLVL